MTTTTRKDPVGEAEHWATVADGINAYWAAEHFEYTDATGRPTNPTKLIPDVARDLMVLSEIVADLARMQASNFKAIKAAHDAIGG